MKKARTWVFIISFAGMAITLAAMGFEIFGRMNPDVLIKEAYIYGICAALFFICSLRSLCRRHSGKKEP